MLEVETGRIVSLLQSKRPKTDYYKIIEEIPKNPVSPCFISFLFI